MGENAVCWPDVGENIVWPRLRGASELLTGEARVVAIGFSLRFFEYPGGAGPVVLFFFPRPVFPKSIVNFSLPIEAASILPLDSLRAWTKGDKGGTKSVKGYFFICGE